uniref:Uncharacterized protein n=1 Tax=Clytia hemisphaerica TaxID=252671 RepID=A0A7M5XM50_9CNID
PGFSKNFDGKTVFRTPTNLPFKDTSFQTELGSITRNASDGLLALLKKNGHESLPKSTQTLLKHLFKLQISDKCGGDYIYLGILKGKQRVINGNCDLDLPQNVSLLVNIDGVPLFKSSPNQIWKVSGVYNFIVAWQSKASECGRIFKGFS